VTQEPRALATGDLRVLARLAEASNLALLAEVSTDVGPLRCIYKPVAGERPLWDFPGAALAAREVLTAEVARCFGWDLVPATMWREDGPFGAGMCQEWVEVVDDDLPVDLFAADRVPHGWCEVAEGRDATGAAIVLAHDASAQMQRLVMLDALVNNADRKGGHILRRTDGSLAAIDHGVTFHAENKLRTVLWGWAGQPIPPDLLAEVGQGAQEFRALVEQWGSDTPHRAAHLSPAEVQAAGRRLDLLLREGTFPMPGADWPSLPWPPM
jgi:uncharacterized repeat protein (TIGR03843 family)